jgi:hypothetical protein
MRFLSVAASYITETLERRDRLPPRRKDAKFGRKKIILNEFTPSFLTFSPWRLCGRYSEFSFVYFAFFAAKSSPASVRGRDESRLYFALFAANFLIHPAR